MIGYIKRFLDYYKKVQQMLREQLDPLALHSEARVVIYGTGGFAELVYMGFRDTLARIDSLPLPHPGSVRYSSHQLSRT